MSQFKKKFEGLGTLSMCRRKLTARTHQIGAHTKNANRVKRDGGWQETARWGPMTGRRVSEIKVNFLCN